MTNLLKKINRGPLSARAVGLSLACLLVAISATAYEHNRTLLAKKGSTPDLSKAKAIALAQPLAFEANQGQADKSVKFLAHARGYTAFLTATESQVRIDGDTTLRMKLRNGNQSPKVQGEDLQVGKSNYLLGNDRSKWIVGVPHFAKVRAKDVYPGIDAVYSGNERQIEYDYVVSPGADPAQIRMSFDGASSVAVNRDGELELHTKGGVMRAHKPVVYQTINGQRKPVNGDFVLLAKNEAGFRVGPYETSKELVIDPTVTVEANVGGGSNDEGFAVAANSTGIVLTGRTQSVTTGAPDKAGTGFPVLGAIQNQHSVPGGSWDAFVTKFTVDPITGVALLSYSTFIGTPLDEAGEGVGLDSLGDVYLAGYTNSASLLASPIVPFSGVYDGFVLELNPAGSAIISSTFIGGAGTTQAFGLAIDPKTGNVVIGGLTTGLTTAPGGAQKVYGGGTTDGFIASFAPTTLALAASTYLGGSSYDQINGVAVDGNGAVYASGFTASGNAGGGGNFPTKSAIAVGNVGAGQQTAFAAKYNNSTSLSSQTYSSIFGVGGEDANGVAADVDGVAYVVGGTKSPNFSTSAQGGCTGGAPVVGGTLPVASTFGGAIQYTGGGPCPATNPNQTQGYLLSLTSAGAINYLDLQTVSANDPANLAGCNLNLAKNGGSFSSGNVCAGQSGSWNGVATDTDEQAYPVGQIWDGAKYNGDVLRFSRGGAFNISEGAAPKDVQNGVAVNNLARLEYVAGTWQATGTTGGPGYEAPNSTPPAPPAPNPPVLAPDSLVANGGEDVSFIGIQWLDVFATPTVISLGPAGVGSAPAPSATVATANQFAVPVSCPLPAVVNGAGTPGGTFTFAALPSTGTYSVTLSTANIGTFSAVATFTCPGADNGTTTVALSGTITGGLNVAPSNTLTSTSPVGTGILSPYNTFFGNAAIQVNVTTPVGSIPYSVSQTGQSAGFPNCGLVAISGGGTANPPPAASNFTVTISAACAALLPLGTYTENISVSSTTPGLAPTVNLPFSLTITSGSIITQGLPNFIFGSSQTPQSGAFTLNAPNAPLNYNEVYNLPFNNVTPLPPANVSILSGAQGSIAAGGSANVLVQVTPVGLANGVYGFCYQAVSATLPNAGNNFACSNVYVGTGLGFINPAGGVLNISVPAGFTAANVTQPATINVTGLANTAASPYTLNLPVAPAGISFTPALPAGAFTLGPPGACNTFAETAVNNTGGGVSCGYTATINTQLVTAGLYTGTVTFSGGVGVTAVLTINLNVTQFPQLSWVNQNLAPLAGITFQSVVNSNTTLCSNNFPFPGIPRFVSTGGEIPLVAATITPTNSWLGIDGGAQGTPGNLGNVNPVNDIEVNPALGGGGNNYGFQICVTAANLARPGTYVGSVSVSGSGVGSTATLPVTFIVSGTGTSNVGIFRAGFEWVLDANGNTTFDGTGHGFDLVEAFGGITGDKVIVGDWSGSGTSKIGIYRPSNGLFILDYNDNGLFDGCLIDRCFQFMASPTVGDLPVAGDWTGSGNFKIGIYRPSTGQWFLDLNNNGILDAGDAIINYGGLAGDIPVTGDWTGTGTTKVGIFRAGFFWILDSNGNGVFDAGDATFAYGGIAGDVPVVGDWNASGITKVGVFRLGFFWVLDTDNDHQWLPGDAAFPFGGLAGDIPVVGKWRMP